MAMASSGMFLLCVLLLSMVGGAVSNENGTSTDMPFSTSNGSTTTTIESATNFSTVSPKDEIFKENITECQYTTGLESRRSNFLQRQPSYIDCDFTKKHACFAYIPDDDSSMVELGCDMDRICVGHNETCFSQDHGRYCCCSMNNCNNYTMLQKRFKRFEVLPDSDLEEYEWWHFPVFILSTFTLIFLFAMILAVLFVIKNISNLSLEEQDKDKNFMKKVNYRHLETVEENRETSLANADVAVQEFYQFLERRRLVKNKRSRSKSKAHQEYVVMKLKVRPLNTLQTLLSERFDLHSAYVKQNKDL